MKKVPVKWKIFWVLSYVQIAIIGVLFLLLCYALIENPIRDATIALIVLALLCIIIWNNSLNVYIMHRYFPDQNVPKKISKAMTVTGAITAILWLFLVAMIVISIISELQVKRNNPYYNNTGMIINIFLLIDWLLGLYLLIFQLELSVVLKKNSKATMQELIESIGQK